MGFIAWILLSLLAGYAGTGRSCGFWGAFLISLIFSPLIGFIVVLICKRKKTQVDYLTEAKVYLDSGIIDEELYKEMVADIMKDKYYTLKYYKERPRKIY